MSASKLAQKSRIFIAAFIAVLFFTLSTMSEPTLNGGNVAVDHDLPALADGGQPGVGGG